MLELKIIPSRVEFNRLIYCKFLIRQGKHILENKTNEQHYNLSVILFANAIELFLYVLDYCLNENDNHESKISELIKKLNKQIKGFNNYGFSKIIQSRNGIYHKAILNTYNVCLENGEKTEEYIKECLRNYLNLKYEDLSLVNVIKDEKTRSSLREAEILLHKEKYEESIYYSCIAFGKFEMRINKRFINNISQNAKKSGQISWKNFSRQVGVNDTKILQILDVFSEHIEEEVNKKFDKFGNILNFIFLLGNKYEDYKHFVDVSPMYFVMPNGEVHVDKSNMKRISLDKENANFIFNFVLNTILDIEPTLKPILEKSITGYVLRRIE